ncbi:uncharacterized protein TNCV_10651 [Trichonephila clavipes]|nr:uncharacterized protein TNCV_10651 [Trichonephila clavipes]
MTAQRYVHDILQPHVLPLMSGLQKASFQQDNAWSHTARVSQDCFLPTVTTLPWPARFPVCLQSNISGIIWMASWVSHEFERTGGKVTANMERNVSRKHTELVCVNAGSYCIVHSR